MTARRPPVAISSHRRAAAPALLSLRCQAPFQHSCSAFLVPAPIDVNTVTSSQNSTEFQCNIDQCPREPFSGAGTVHFAPSKLTRPDPALQIVGPTALWATTTAITAASISNFSERYRERLGTTEIAAYVVRVTRHVLTRTHEPRVRGCTRRGRSAIRTSREKLPRAPRAPAAPPILRSRAGRAVRTVECSLYSEHACPAIRVKLVLSE